MICASVYVYAASLFGLELHGHLVRMHGNRLGCGGLQGAVRNPDCVQMG
jgi:hypothetical protein